MISCYILYNHITNTFLLFNSGQIQELEMPKYCQVSELGLRTNELDFYSNCFLFGGWGEHYRTVNNHLFKDLDESHCISIACHTSDKSYGTVRTLAYSQ